MDDALPILLALIRRFEGLRLHAYLCPAGIPTIGYGATGPEIQLGLTWTATEAEERLQRDAPRYLSAARKLCPGLSGGPLAAVASLAYNIGSTRLSASTLRRKANAGNMAGAAAEFPKWVHAAGRVLPGLVLRREAERSIFYG